ncbi:MAG: hypothetical protein ACJ77K_18905 [Bacteroidia bacterium]
MKKSSLFFFLVLLLQACNHDKCADESCVKAEGHKVIGDTSNVSCKLTSADLQKRRETVLSLLKSKTIEERELPNGYSFRFDNTDEMIDTLTDFVKSERQCCDFFNFTINIKNDGTLWFDLTGPQGAKEMIGSELGL